jgi:hypothetical protein
VIDLINFPWTAEAGGSIYADTPEGRRQVGMMTARDVAEEAADSHNAALAARTASARAARHGVTRMTGLTGVQIGDGGTQNNVF